MIYRSLILGLVGALVLIEATRVRHARPRPGPASTIVDVSQRALDQGAVDVAPVVGLRPGERIAMIDDAVVVDGASALGVALHAAHPGQYVDLDVRRAGGDRRVLVLVH
jgi:hypothetical protein